MVNNHLPVFTLESYLLPLHSQNPSQHLKFSDKHQLYNIAQALTKFLEQTLNISDHLIFVLLPSSKHINVLSFHSDQFHSLMKTLLLQSRIAFDRVDISCNLMVVIENTLLLSSLSSSSKRSDEITASTGMSGSSIRSGLNGGVGSTMAALRVGEQSIQCVKLSLMVGTSLILLMKMFGISAMLLCSGMPGDVISPSPPSLDKVDFETTLALDFMSLGMFIPY